MRATITSLLDLVIAPKSVASTYGIYIQYANIADYHIRLRWSKCCKHFTQVAMHLDVQLVKMGDTYASKRHIPQ